MPHAKLRIDSCMNCETILFFIYINTWLVQVIWYLFLLNRVLSEYIITEKTLSLSGPTQLYWISRASMGFQIPGFRQKQKILYIYITIQFNFITRRWLSALVYFTSLIWKCALWSINSCYYRFYFWMNAKAVCREQYSKLICSDRNYKLIHPTN